MLLLLWVAGDDGDVYISDAVVMDVVVVMLVMVGVTVATPFNPSLTS